jgi:predicted O-linked N-acetylglucosamine transferase (SPINDLY family)
MDYVVVDPVVVPHEYAKYYTEKLAVLPHSYHVVDHKQSYGIQSEPDRRSRGLPDNKFIFCNHANNIRMSPSLFDHWMSIVKKSPNSTMVLKHFNDEATANLKIEAKRRGMLVSDNIDESQLLFQHGIGGSEHITVKSMCDLYLDSRYYNGHSTTADMLWAGVPLVTYPSDTMAGRAAASFLTSTGVPQHMLNRMIASSWDDYENKAIDLAKNRHTTTKAIRERIRSTRMTMPFFDTKRWVGNFERAMEQMFAKYMAEKPPDHIYVIDTNP